MKAFPSKKEHFLQLSEPNSEPSAITFQVAFDGLWINVSYRRYLESSSKNC